MNVCAYARLRSDDKDDANDSHGGDKDEENKESTEDHPHRIGYQEHVQWTWTYCEPERANG